MSARADKRLPMVLVIDQGKYRGCALNRGKTGWEAWSAADLSLGIYPTPEQARDRVLEARP